MKIDRDELCSLIPHHGTMCLLDQVSYWDDSRVVCTTMSHRQTDNPLLRDGCLHVVNGAEYGAQAMAVHGGLMARREGQALSPGYLAALRSVEFFTDHLDTIPTPLTIEAQQLLASGGSLIYEFTVSGADELLLKGRATVITQTES
ncbi:hypothetical protein [Kaarinaea lacus]